MHLYSCWPVLGIIISSRLLKWFWLITSSLNTVRSWQNIFVTVARYIKNHFLGSSLNRLQLGLERCRCVFWHDWLMSSRNFYLDITPKEMLVAATWEYRHGGSGSLSLACFQSRQSLWLSSTIFDRISSRFSPLRLRTLHLRLRLVWPYTIVIDRILTRCSWFIEILHSHLHLFRYCLSSFAFHCRHSREDLSGFHVETLRLEGCVFAALLSTRVLTSHNDI